MIDKEDIIAEYEKQLQKKDNEIEQVNNMNLVLMEILKEKDKKINKAIGIFEECIKTQDWSTCELEMYEALKGEDKE